MKRREVNRLLLGASLLGLAPSSCKDGRNETSLPVEWSSVAFDTEVVVNYVLPNGRSEKVIAKKLAQRTFELEKLFSLSISDSELCRLNRNGRLEGASVEFVKVLKDALNYGAKTGGLFDISVQVLWEWYQGVSEQQSLEQVLKLINYSSIQCEGSHVSMKNGMKLTLNGCIQGYLTDQLYSLLEELGVQHALVNGGEFRQLGSAHSDWKSIEIRAERGQIGEVELFRGEALAVSAGYGYSIEHGDEVHPHILDPRGFVEVDRNLTFAVVASSAMQADVYSTALSLLGEGDSARFNSSYNRALIFKDRELVFDSKVGV